MYFATSPRTLVRLLSEVQASSNQTEEMHFPGTKDINAYGAPIESLVVSHANISGIGIEVFLRMNRILRRSVSILRASRVENEDGGVAFPGMRAIHLTPSEIEGCK